MTVTERFGNFILVDRFRKSRKACCIDELFEYGQGKQVLTKLTVIQTVENIKNLEVNWSRAVLMDRHEIELKYFGIRVMEIFEFNRFSILIWDTSDRNL